MTLTHSRADAEPRPNKQYDYSTRGRQEVGEQDGICEPALTTPLGYFTKNQGGGEKCFLFPTVGTRGSPRAVDQPGAPALRSRGLAPLGVPAPTRTPCRTERTGTGCGLQGLGRRAGVRAGVRALGDRHVSALPRDTPGWPDGALVPKPGAP